MTFDFASLKGDLDPTKERNRQAMAASRKRAATGFAVAPRAKRGRNEAAKQRSAENRQAKLKERLDNIAVLDFETDPFADSHLERERIAPFTACLYSENFDPVVIWDENEENFYTALIAEIEKLPGKYIIYAHNGGKFDFMFMISRLRGRVSFKGRGLMCANIGEHELRDSYHLIPESLAAYQKDDFDYSKMLKKNRKRNRKEIIAYMVNDCKYTYQLVKAFLTEYGIKMSIGQAALGLIKKEYPEIKSIKKNDDEFLRNFFYGGRVECIAGRGIWNGEYKLYDVNSMYPFAMVNFMHPIGNDYKPRCGEPSPHTVFIDLDCYSEKAFPLKVDGVGTTFPAAYNNYRVTIHEYKVALELGLIKDIRINYCVDCFELTDFSRFILPLYEARQITKGKLNALKKMGDTSSAEYMETKKDDLFLKLLMNNAYGKFCQNPRKFKEYYITDSNGEPDNERDTWGKFPAELCRDYAIWERPIKSLRFNNVGTGASITGAARAVLLRARTGAIDPIYCDTDSLICKDITGVDFDPVRLGAWDCEAEISRVMIAGKKLYGYEKIDGTQQMRTKGGRRLTWGELESVVKGNVIKLYAKGPTLTRDGQQSYIDRNIRATA